MVDVTGVTLDIRSTISVLIERHDKTCDPCDSDVLMYKLEQLFHILLAINVPLSILEN